MIKVNKYAYEYVSDKVIDSVLEEIKETGDKQLDFSGLSILNYTHECIAKLVAYYDVELFNIESLKDREKVEFYLDKLNDPHTDNINNYKLILKKRFKKGDVCILNERKFIGKRDGGYKRSLVLIKDYIDRGILIRKYYSSKLQPKYFEEAGGKDSKSLYINTELSYVDLYNGEIRLENPKNSVERQIIDVLFK